MFASTALALSLAAAQGQLTNYAPPPLAPPILQIPPPPPPLVRAQPVNPLGDYLSDDDYPALAIRNLEEGTVRFQLYVDEDGLVDGCTILQSSGSLTLDAAACRIMRSRVRFVPARDFAGRPTPDRLSSRINWVLPPDDPADPSASPGETDAGPATDGAPPPPVVAPLPLYTPIGPPRARLGPGTPGPAPAVPTHPYAFYFTAADYPAAARASRLEGEVHFALTVAATGRVTGCTITTSSGSPLLDAATCRVLRRRGRYQPAQNQAGHAIAGVDRGLFRWRLPEN